MCTHAESLSVWAGDSTHTWTGQKVFTDSPLLIRMDRVVLNTGLGSPLFICCGVGVIYTIRLSWNNQRIAHTVEGLLFLSASCAQRIRCFVMWSVCVTLKGRTRGSGNKEADGWAGSNKNPGSEQKTQHMLPWKRLHLKRDSTDCTLQTMFMIYFLKDYRITTTPQHLEICFDV